MNLEKHRLNQAKEIGEIKGIVKGIAKSVDDFAPRLRKVEKRQSWIAGVFVALGSVVTLIGTYFKIKG